MSGIGLFLFSCSFIIFWGCAPEGPKPAKVPMPPPAARKAPAKAPAKPASAPIIVVKVEPPPVDTYTYDPRGKTDPFKPLYEEPKPKPATAKTVKEKDPKLTATPLERMELKDLKLVALVWNIPKPKAMVEGPGGAGYILTTGTAVGKNDGVVTSISSGGAEVSEKYENAAGKVQIRVITLKLYVD